MPIFISNSSYLSGDDNNRPFVGWHSVLLPSSASNDVSLPIIGLGELNLWSPDTYTKWVATNGGGSSVQCGIIFNIGESVDYYGIAGHNFGDIGATYRWQVLDAPAGSWVDLTTPRLLSDNRSIIDYVNPSIPIDNIARLLITVPAGKTVRIAHVKIGLILQLQRRIWTGEVPSGMDKRVDKVSSKSYSGAHLGSIVISRGNAFAINQENNTVEFVRTNQLQNFFKHSIELIQIANGAPETFFYAWRPDSHPYEVQYCTTVNDFSPPSNSKPTSSGGLMRWSMSGSALE